MKESELSGSEIYKINTLPEKGAKGCESAQSGTPPNEGIPASFENPFDRALEDDFPDMLALLRREARELNESVDPVDGERAWAELKARFARQQPANTAGAALEITVSDPVHPLGLARFGTRTRVGRARGDGEPSAPSDAMARFPGRPTIRWPDPLDGPRRPKEDMVSALVSWLRSGSEYALFGDGVDDLDLTSDLGRTLVLVDVLRRLEYSTSQAPESAVLWMKQRAGGYLIAIREPGGEARGRSQFSFSKCLYGIFEKLDAISPPNADLVEPDLHDFILMACFPVEQADGKPAKKSRYTIGQVDEDTVSEFLGQRRAQHLPGGQQFTPAWTESRLARLLRRNSASIVIPTILPLPGLSQPTSHRKASSSWSDRVTRASQQIVHMLAQDHPSGLPLASATTPPTASVTVARRDNWAGSPPGSTWSPHAPSSRARHRRQDKHTYVMWAGDMRREGSGPLAASAENFHISKTATGITPPSVPPLNVYLPISDKKDEK